jgi:hypothetical protein
VRKKPPVDWSTSVVPSDEQIEDICEQFGFKTNAHDELRVFVNDLLASVKKVYESDRKTKTEQIRLRIVRASVDRYVDNLSRLADWLTSWDMRVAYQEREGSEHRFSLIARRAFEAATKGNGPGMPEILDPWFLTKTSGAAPVGALLESNNQPVAFSLADRDRFCSNFVSNNPPLAASLIVGALLNTFKNLRNEIAKVTPRGGEPPRWIEKWVIMNIAIQYERMGKAPSGKRDGEFQLFAEEIVKSIGQPSEWVASQLQDGIANWKQRGARNLSQNREG